MTNEPRQLGTLNWGDLKKTIRFSGEYEHIRGEVLAVTHKWDGVDVIFQMPDGEMRQTGPMSPKTDVLIW